MTAAVTALVVMGLLFSASAGIAGGLDLPSAAFLLLMAVLGGLGIAVSRRARWGSVRPRRCDRCGGLNSPSAPNCKHCGAPAA